MILEPNSLIAGLKLLDAPADGDILKWSGSRPTWAAESSQLASATVKTADQTTTSTTPANVTSMSFSVVSGTYYSFNFSLLFQTDVGARNVKVALTTPTFTSFGARVQIPNDSAEGTGKLWTGPITASGGTITPTGSSLSTATDYVASIEGVILPSANGTLQLQFAVASVTGSPTITARQGSSGLLWTLT